MSALRHTTTDVVTLYDADHPSTEHASDLAQATQWMADAGLQARSERMLRLPGAGNLSDALHRATGSSQVWPEWALAGCQSYIVAPRRNTAARHLGGRAFLHDHD